MASNSAIGAVQAQASPLAAQQLQQRLLLLLAPLLQTLDHQLDVRLVRTFLATIIAIIQWRNRPHGLLLSELGAYLLQPNHAPAGTKRLSNLLRSSHWSAELIRQFLWDQADRRVMLLRAAGQTPLLIWEESVLEKPETLKNPDLCAVRSSKARRLKRIRPGFFNPPGGPPICVPGLHWLGLLLVGQSGAPVVAAMQWWSTRGKHASDHTTQLQHLLEQTAASWKREVLHIWDRGFATGPWLQQMLTAGIRCVVRWKKGTKLLDGWGEERKAWEIMRGKRSWEYRMLRDQRTGQVHKVGVVAVCVTHPAHPQPLWLVVARHKGQSEPWYLLTSETVRTAEDGWAIVMAYARRWQSEWAWRYSKSELAVESPRVWTWERREKLLLMVTLAYVFLLSLLESEGEQLRSWLLRVWCHRTGKRSRDATAPLYRLRSALSRLWQAYLPAPLATRLTSG